MEEEKPTFHSIRMLHFLNCEVYPHVSLLHTSIPLRVKQFYNVAQKAHLSNLSKQMN